MKRALLVAWVCVGCSGAIVGGERPAATVTAEGPASPSVEQLGPPACSTGVRGRSYRGLAGEVLEAYRSDADPGFDRLRPSPNPNISGDWALFGLIMRSVGGDYHSAPELRDPSVGNTFGNVPLRWYEQADIGAFSLSLSFNFAFDSCLFTFEKQRTYWNTKDWLELTDAFPTQETATRFCSHSVPYALARQARPAELEACVSTIMDVAALGEETEPRRLWAYGCAVTIATPMYLTF